jgi:hypothetical protein
MEMTNSEESSENNAGTQDYRGGPGGYGPPGNGRGGRGYGPPGNGRGGPGYGRGGYCRWGCCRRGYSGCICCMHPNEIPEPMYIPEVQN